MKRFLLVVFASVLFQATVHSQTDKIVLKGRVTDKATHEGIAFVSIGIEGTSIGTATNPDGYFQLKVPDEFKTKNLYFSAIGYVSGSYSMLDFKPDQDIQITLAPQSYKIEAIDVAAESLVLQRILRTASERIPENYQEGPFGMKIFYQEQQSLGDNAFSSNQKIIVNLYDRKGYTNPGWANAFKDRNYAIAERQSDKQAIGFRDASNNFDELLELDLARLSNTIMNPELLGDYKLNLEGKTTFNGDSVWTISYSANKHDLAHTGSYYPTSFSGKLYISCADYVVLRNEIHLTAAKENQQGRSLAVKTNANTDVQMNLTTEYKKMNGKYVLSYMNMEKQFKGPNGTLVYVSGKAVVLNVDRSNPRPVMNRQYLAQTTTDESFWKTFRMPAF
jgi:hypothetical protein